jgi:hypothetical protein
MYYPFDRRLKPLTTPVSYMSTLPADPFFSAAVEGSEGDYDLYVYAPGNLYHGADKDFASNIYRNTIYSIAGRGPDKDINVGGYCMAHPIAYANKTNVLGMYDPTNGTVSEGDVFKTGAGTLGQSK